MRKNKLLFSLLVGLFILSFQSLAFSSEKKQEQEIKQKSLIQTTIPHDRFSFGTYAMLQSHKSGGGFELGFLLYQKNSFCIRNHNTFNLYLTNPALSHGTGFSISERLVFGALKSHNGFLFRTYGFFRIEMIVAMDKTHALTATPFILEMGGAGGFEFLFLKNHGFFAEFGGGAAMASFRKKSALEEIAKGAFKGGYAALTIGVRHYF